MTVDPNEVHRYYGDESWPTTAKIFAERVRAENASLQNQLNERGPRPARYAPDFSDIEGTSIFIQWKGTNVCLDFYCDCGAQGHFDGDFAYSLRCGTCGQVWLLPHSVALVPVFENPSNSKDVEMDGRWKEIHDKLTEDGPGV